jgi:hypothetical protein
MRVAARGAILVRPAYLPAPYPPHVKTQLRRVIQRERSDRLAVLLLDGTVNAGDTIHIGVADDRLSFH